MTPTEKCVSGTIIILILIADTVSSTAANRKTILVTGGGGYIGSHTVVELLNRNYSVVVIDNKSNCYARNPSEKPESLKRIEDLTGRGVVFYDVDIRDKASLDKVFKIHAIDAVIHFAALKSISESIEKPEDYYENNVAGTNNLLQVMKKHKVYCIIYSSSATVYGEPEFLPITETHPTGQKLTNPYGRSKYFTEEILKDITATNSEWKVISLRYFNPVGAHPSGLIGEDPFDIPNNLMPYISQVAVGRRDRLNVFGYNYPTHDGTGVRDFIHISDLAIGHLRALKQIFGNKFKGWKVYNLGTGKGYSVLEMLEAFERVSGRSIYYEFTDKRPGDIPAVYADVSLAKRELNWKAEKGIDEMCEDTWNWQRRNPNGYRPILIADTVSSTAANRKTILVTGGGGYIGSHTVVELLNRNYSVVVIDNLSNCYARNSSEKPESLKRIEDLTGRGVVFYDVDIRDKASLDKVFKIHAIDAVIHFAALKSVSESVEKPADYYENNVAGTNNLLQVMKKHKVYCIIYSSSATVYGEPEFLPLTETHPTGQKLKNPYGRSKYFTEEILKDIAATNSEWKVISLRYFNPVGAHPSGLIGEDPFDIPNNLMPYISQVAVGRRDRLNVFGSDYPTHDGTGVRDFIHISDLAIGHLRAYTEVLSFSMHLEYL